MMLQRVGESLQKLSDKHHVDLHALACVEHDLLVSCNLPVCVLMILTRQKQQNRAHESLQAHHLLTEKRLREALNLAPVGLRNRHANGSFQCIQQLESPRVWQSLLGLRVWSGNMRGRAQGIKDR